MSILNSVRDFIEGLGFGLDKKSTEAYQVLCSLTPHQWPALKADLLVIYLNEDGYLCGNEDIVCEDDVDDPATDGDWKDDTFGTAYALLCGVIEDMHNSGVVAEDLQEEARLLQAQFYQKYFETSQFLDSYSLTEEGDLAHDTILPFTSNTGAVYALTVAEYEGILSYNLAASNAMGVVRHVNTHSVDALKRYIGCILTSANPHEEVDFDDFSTLSELQTIVFNRFCNRILLYKNGVIPQPLLIHNDLDDVA